MTNAWEDYGRLHQHAAASSHWAWRMWRLLTVDRSCGWNRRLFYFARWADRSTPRLPS